MIYQSMWLINNTSVKQKNILSNTWIINTLGNGLTLLEISKTISCNSTPLYHIATKFCTCHDSTAVVACAKFCSDHNIIHWMRFKHNFHWLWITIETHYCNHPLYQQRSTFHTIPITAHHQTSPVNQRTLPLVCVDYAWAMTHASHPIGANGSKRLNAHPRRPPRMMAVKRCHFLMGHLWRESSVLLCPWFVMDADGVGYCPSNLVHLRTGKHLDNEANFLNIMGTVWSLIMATSPQDMQRCVCVMLCVCIHACMCVMLVVCCVRVKYHLVRTQFTIECSQMI